MERSYFDFKLMILGGTLILAASPLAEKSSEISLACVALGLMFVLIGLATNPTPKQ